MNPLIVFPKDSQDTGIEQPAVPWQARRRAPITFESKTTRRRGPNEVDYTGRLLCLNPEFIRRSFQCYGFFLGGPANQSGIVPEHADMVSIGRALAEQCLLDMTDRGELKTEHSTLSELAESATPKKVYLLRMPSGETVAYGTDNREQQIEFDGQIAAHGLLELPPGFGEEEKYLLPTPVAEPRVDLEFARRLLAERKMSWPRRVSRIVYRWLTSRL